MSLTVLLGAVEQGFIYALVALALYVSYRTLNIADLSTDGTFVLGAACSASLTLAGHPLLGLLAAFAAGGLAGCVTALLQTKLQIQPILAGIITMTGLYSINLMAMGGRSNLPILKCGTVYTLAEGALGQAAGLAVSAAAALACAGALAWFLRTQLGLSLRATGDNRAMVAASSINPAFTTLVGLCLANALVALSGGLLAQYQKFSDATIGPGMVVIGLASLIIGEVFTGGARRTGAGWGVAAAVGGAVVYRILYAFALTSNVGASNLKLVSALIVAAAIGWPAAAARLRLARKRREEARKC